MKVLGYILTAAAVLVGADVFVASTESQETDTITSEESAPTTLYGGNGMPTPPPN